MANGRNVRRTRSATGYRSSRGTSSRGRTSGRPARGTRRGSGGSRRSAAPRQQVVKLQLQLVPASTLTQTSGIVDAFNQQAAVPKAKAKF